MYFMYNQARCVCVICCGNADINVISRWDEISFCIVALMPQIF